MDSFTIEIFPGNLSKLFLDIQVGSVAVIEQKKLSKFCLPPCEQHYSVVQHKAVPQ